MTTLASMSEAVEKMTTGGIRIEDGVSGMRRGFRHVLDSQQEHSHIVLLRGCSRKRLHVTQDAFADLRGTEIGVLLEQFCQPHVAKTLSLGFIVSLIPSV